MPPRLIDRRATLIRSGWEEKEKARIAPGSSDYLTIPDRALPDLTSPYHTLPKLDFAVQRSALRS